MNAENPAQSATGGPFTPVTAQPTSRGAADGAPTGGTPSAPMTSNRPATSSQTAAPTAQARSASTPATSAPVPTAMQPTGAQPGGAGQSPQQRPPAHPGVPRTGPQTASQPGRPAASQSAAQPTTGAQPGTPRRASFKTTGQIPTTAAAPADSTTGTTETEQPKKKSRMAALANLRSNKSKDITDTEPTQTPKGGPRKVRVMVSTVDPWSIMKLAFLTAVSAGIMLVIGVSIVWNVLNSMGVFADIKEQIVTLFALESEVQILQFFDYGRWMSGTILVAVFNVVIATALATIGSLLYNVVVKLVGGVYVTLTDE